MTIKVTKTYTIEVAGQEHQVTEKEVHDLYQQLKEIVGEKKSVTIPRTPEPKQAEFPLTPHPYPQMPWKPSAPYTSPFGPFLINSGKAPDKTWPTVSENPILHNPVGEG